MGKEIKINKKILTKDKNLLKRVIFMSLFVVILPTLIVFSFDVNLVTLFIVGAIFISMGILVDIFFIPRICERDGLELKKWREDWSAWPYHVYYYKCKKGHIHREVWTGA